MREFPRDLDPSLPQNIPSPALRDFFASIESTCLPRIEKATVPLLGVQETQIRHDRTGVLYQIGDHHFILTAAHDLRAIVQSNIPLYVSMNAKDREPIPLPGAKVHSPEKDGRDVAAIWLPPDLAQDIARHKDFLRHNQINMQKTGPRIPYVFFGYPMLWSGHVVAENHIHSRALAFATIEHEDQRHDSTFYDPNVHITLGFCRDAVDLQNSSSEMLPKIHGISGCGIWQVGDLSELGLRSRSCSSVTLIGIQHTWFPDHGYVQATRIRYVLNLILANYPELEAPMSVLYAKQ
jgi:hypothetical protein